MKKYVFAILLLIPVVSMGASSVRVLGNQQHAGTTNKVVSVKAPVINKTNQNPVMRTGTTKVKNSGVKGVMTGSGVRFPVMSPAKTYDSVTQISDKPTGTACNDTCISDSTIKDIKDSVADTIQSNMLDNYYTKSETYNNEQVYNKAEVYNNNNFIQAVKDVDDPRIDAIRTRDPSSLHSAQLPDDYIYVWIEK